jgi:formate dehydrogenase assembly factor FdhD
MSTKNGCQMKIFKKNNEKEKEKEKEERAIANYELCYMYHIATYSSIRYVKSNLINQKITLKEKIIFHLAKTFRMKQHYHMPIMLCRTDFC